MNTRLSEATDSFSALATCAPPAAMQGIAQAVASLKSDVDGLVFAQSPLVDLLAEPFGILRGPAALSYAEAVIPFLDWLRLRHDTRPPERFALIDVQVVIGWSWRWSPKDHEDPIGREQNEALLQKFQTWAAEWASGLASDKSNVACCTWLPSLGIACAEEGKNRVALYRACGAAYLPALVTTYDYPEAARITRYIVAGRELVVLDKQWACALSGGQLSRDLLDAYGVKAEHRWPDDLPPLADVLDVLAPPEVFQPWRLSGDAPLHVGCNLDLRVLARRLEQRQASVARDAEVIPVSLLDVEGLEFVKSYWLWAALVTTLSIVVAAALPASIAPWVLLPGAVSFGMLILPCCGAWRTPRALTRPRNMPRTSPVASRR